MADSRTYSAQNVDAIIIGAGIMGCSIALALTRKGYRTLNLDRLPAAGYGSTSSSAAIIRPYYSTLEGTALAYEGHFYWQNWREFLGADAHTLLAHYVQCGCLVLMPPGSDRLASTRRVLGEAGVPFEVLGPEELRRVLPMLELQSFTPPKRIENADFGKPNAQPLEGAIAIAAGGYINDPQLACRNLQQAGGALGAQYRFNARVMRIDRADGRVGGVTLEDGTRIAAPVVINAAGPHSAQVNALAGVRSPEEIAAKRGKSLEDIVG